MGWLLWPLTDGASRLPFTQTQFSWLTRSGLTESISGIAWFPEKILRYGNLCKDKMIDIVAAMIAPGMTNPVPCTTLSVLQILNAEFALITLSC